MFHQYVSSPRPSLSHCCPLGWYFLSAVLKFLFPFMIIESCFHAWRSSAINFVGFLQKYVLSFYCVKVKRTKDISVMWRQLFFQNNAIRIAHVRSGSVFSNFPPRNIRLGKTTLCDFSPNSGYFGVGDSSGFLSLFTLNHFNKYWQEHSPLTAANQMYGLIFLQFHLGRHLLLSHDWD